VPRPPLSVVQVHGKRVSSKGYEFKLLSVCTLYICGSVAGQLWVRESVRYITYNSCAISVVSSFNSYTIKKIYKYCLYSFTQTVKSQQNNCLNFKTIKLSYHDNADKSYFKINVKKNNYYNYERLSHFIKNCRSFLKNFNYIKINAVKTKKDRVLLTAF